LKNIRLIK